MNQVSFRRWEMVDGTALKLLDICSGWGRGGCKQQLNHRRTEANGRSEEMIVNKLE